MTWTMCPTFRSARKDPMKRRRRKKEEKEGQTLPQRRLEIIFPQDANGAVVRQIVLAMPFLIGEGLNEAMMWSTPKEEKWKEKKEKRKKKKEKRRKKREKKEKNKLTKSSTSSLMAVRKRMPINGAKVYHWPVGARSTLDIFEGREGRKRERAKVNAQKNETGQEKGRGKGREERKGGDERGWLPV